MKKTTTKKRKATAKAQNRWKNIAKPIDYMRQIIVINDDLNMSPGKVASQAAHAAIAAAFASTYQDLMQWGIDGPTKIVLRATEKQMQRVIRLAKKHKLVCKAFIDAPPTTEGTAYKMTALAVGPHVSAAFKPVTGHLKLY
jgi:peptidyl-tRNA hydrolase, PTH2 family